MKTFDAPRPGLDRATSALARIVRAEVDLLVEAAFEKRDGFRLRTVPVATRGKDDNALMVEHGSRDVAALTEIPQQGSRRFGATTYALMGEVAKIVVADTIRRKRIIDTRVSIQLGGINFSSVSRLSEEQRGVVQKDLSIKLPPVRRSGRRR